MEALNNSVQMCVCVYMTITRCTDSEAFKPLTVMYFTSMSVFLSSSAIISLWNLFNYSRRRWKRHQEEERTAQIRNWVEG